MNVRRPQLETSFDLDKLRRKTIELPPANLPLYDLKLSCGHTTKTLKDIALSPPPTFWCRQCCQRVRTR